MSGIILPPVFDLTGRTALITGASSGLGARFARLLAGAGANVVVAARRTDLLDGLCAGIEAEGRQATAVAMDVADEASVIAGFDAAQERFGTVDTVIANAGMNNEGMIPDLSVEDFDQVMAVNLRGVFLTAREASRRMIAANFRQSGRGRITLISSITAHHISPGVAAYSASKAAVSQFGKVAARDWARQGINVNMILPGYILTDINADWFEEEGGKKQIARFPRKRLMRQEELDVMALYLSSDLSEGITGAEFVIDDGQTL